MYRVCKIFACLYLFSLTFPLAADKGHGHRSANLDNDKPSLYDRNWQKVHGRKYDYSYNRNYYYTPYQNSYDYWPNSYSNGYGYDSDPGQYVYPGEYYQNEYSYPSNYNSRYYYYQPSAYHLD